MYANEFLALLEQHSEVPLDFEFQPQQRVRSDYHITEIKNVCFDTVDCGGVQNEWKEVHVQLWENEVLEPHHQVTTSRAVSIFQTVDKTRKTLSDVEIKFEYGNDQFPKSVLPVQNVTLNEGRLLVSLGHESTCCKAKLRATTDEERDAACCAPVPQKLEPKPVGLPISGDCSPGSGCC